jgi:hypothetical protein
MRCRSRHCETSSSQVSILRSKETIRELAGTISWIYVTYAGNETMLAAYAKVLRKQKLNPHDCFAA